MGGASGVLTADSKEEVLEKARDWFVKAEKGGLHPRRDFIYGRADTPVDYLSPATGKMETAYVVLVDITQRPKDTESALPFPMYSESLSAEAKKKRWFCFVSAHT